MRKLFARFNRAQEHEHIRELEESIRKELCRGACHVTFWGSLELNPDRVFVSEKQARISIQNLKRLIQ